MRPLSWRPKIVHGRFATGDDYMLVTLNSLQLVIKMRRLPRYMRWCDKDAITHYLTRVRDDHSWLCQHAF
jgi:hypothetical protein